MNRRLFVQKSIKVVTFLGISPSFISTKTGFDVKHIEESFKEYIEDPNDETANQLYNIIPLFDSYDQDRKNEIANTLDLNFNVLETHIGTGSKSAIDLAFRLFSITDGALSSLLNMTIGPYLHIDPSYFLKSLKKHSHLVVKKKVLGNLGIDLVDEVRLQDQEIEKRIYSLEKVDDPSLSNIKNECVGILINKHHDVDDYLLEMYEKAKN